MTLRRGLLLVLEGIDGSGKDTQLARLRPWLAELAVGRGYSEPLFSYEPGAGLGAGLRQLLLRTTEPLDPLAETLLFLADRAQHMTQVVRPLLDNGKPVVLNRHTASTLAYQGYGKGVSLDEIVRLNRLVTGGIEPDRIYLLDVSVEEALKRFQQREGGPGDRLESAGTAFLQRVRDGYLAQAKAAPDRWRVLDANRPAAAIQQELRADIEVLLGP